MNSNELENSKSYLFERPQKVIPHELFVISEKPDDQSSILTHRRIGKMLNDLSRAENSLRVDPSTMENSKYNTSSAMLVNQMA